MNLTLLHVTEFLVIALAIDIEEKGKEYGMLFGDSFFVSTNVYAMNHD